MSTPEFDVFCFFSWKNGKNVPEDRRFQKKPAANNTIIPMKGLRHMDKFDGQEKILHGNLARIPKDADVVSKFVTQAISHIAAEEKNVPLCTDRDVRLEREWSVENKK